jgi:predicted nucleotidyltransferase component of viral defense system
VYLDLRKTARSEGRATDELLQLYALEGFLNRLSQSRFSDRFVLKGGVLMSAFDARRPTRDIDLATVRVSLDESTAHEVVVEVITLDLSDGLAFDPNATTTDSIRVDETYGAVRVSIRGRLATAVVTFHVDISAGDPMEPAPFVVNLPRILGGEPLRLRGYRPELVLGEKIITAVQRGTANTRWRDFVDIAALSSVHTDRDSIVAALVSVADHRRVDIRGLSAVLAGYGQLAQSRWAAWRRKQGLVDSTPERFGELLDVVVEFADPLLDLANEHRRRLHGLEG